MSATSTAIPYRAGAIAILSLDDERGSCWKAQSGLPADLAPDPSGTGNEIDRLLAPGTSTRVIEDILQDDRLAKSTFQNIFNHPC